MLGASTLPAALLGLSARPVAGGGWLLESAWPGAAFWWLGAAAFAACAVSAGRRAEVSGRAWALGAVGVAAGAALGVAWAGEVSSLWVSLWATAGAAGGLLAGASTGPHGAEAARAADACAPGALVGLGIARLGCLWRGCDFGAPTGEAWGVRYPRGAAAFRWLYDQGEASPWAGVSAPLHPFPLYEALPALALGLWAALSARPSGAPGRVALGCAWGYAASRGMAELYRGGAAAVALPWGGQAGALALACAGAAAAAAACAAGVAWARVTSRLNGF